MSINLLSLTGGVVVGNVVVVATTFTPRKKHRSLQPK